MKFFKPEDFMQLNGEYLNWPVIYQRLADLCNEKLENAGYGHLNKISKQINELVEELSKRQIPIIESTKKCEHPKDKITHGLWWDGVVYHCTVCDNRLKPVKFEVREIYEKT